MNDNNNKGNNLNNSTNIFLRLFEAFKNTPRQKLLRAIDHSMVVLGIIYLFTMLGIAGINMAVTDPVNSQFQNIFAVGLTIFIFIAAFSACEYMTRQLITSSR